MDLDGNLFWWFAGALVATAVVISFTGIRGKEKFPPSGPVMAVGIVAIASLVVVTAAFGVALAREEKEHRDHEIEQAEAEAEAAVGEETSEGGSPSGEPPAEADSGGAPGGEAAPGAAGGEQGGGGETLDVTSPADGSLVFEPDGLQAAAGTITLAYANPSSVPHNIAVEGEGETLEESDTISESETEISAELSPGEYIYFCTVPGHREGGMEGTLTVE